MQKENTKNLYDSQALDWQREKPTLLSDFSARPHVIEHCGDVTGKKILDLGCGEGYLSRLLIKNGCEQITGVDLSKEMISVADQIKNEQNLDQATYISCDVNQFLEEHSEKYDVIIAVFLFNYIDTASMSHVIDKTHDLLTENGKFIFTVPHPSLPFIKSNDFPFYFNAESGYFSGKDQLFDGKIWRLDRIPTNVQCVHKTFSDYFNVLNKSPYRSIPELHELHITEKHIALDPEFFTPLADLPLHVLFKLSK